jgi:protein involved in polysaccharide export with SLBB domain
LAFLAPALALAAPAAAQPTTVPTLQETPLPTALRQQVSGPGVALEGVVDAEAYIVGPGDVFAFSIGGRMPVEQRATVSADGMLIVPEVGTLRAGGRTLAAVRGDLRAALRRRYSNVDSDAALAEPRRFLVHVTGAVTAPGRHPVMPLARVEDALAEALGGPPLLVLREMQSNRVAVLPALRNVQVRRVDGRVLTPDLLRYYATGDLTHNPFLRDGDIIHVPSFHRQGAAVFVEHRFDDPRVYDLRPADTAADLVALARGPGAPASLESVRLIRTGPDGGLTVQTFEGPGLEAALAAAPLAPLDRIQLVDPNEAAGRIAVEGAVRFPGSYPLTEGRTTLAEVVRRAGGLLPTALPDAATIERPGIQEVPYQPFDAAQRLANLEDQAFQSGRLAELSFEGRQYLSRELGRRRIEVDVDAVLAGSAPDILLRDGDRLNVPEDPGGVMVLGQVRSGGLIPHREGASAEYYIAEAGGLAPAATDIYVREGGSGLLRPAAGATIRSGDVLFVDRLPAAFSETQQSLLLQRQQYEAQVRRDRAEGRNRLITTALGIVGTAFTAVTLYLTINSNTR